MESQENKQPQSPSALPDEPRKRRRPLSLKQKRAFANLVENGGNVSKAMIDAGYSEATAKTPQKLTESDAFKELVARELPDDLLLKVHKEGLDAMQYRGQDAEIQVADYQTRHKYLVTGYEIRGKLRPDELDRNVNVIIPVIINNGKAKGDRPTPETV
jgi:hypothetical protein